ncbi:MAG: hypothetical protein ACI4IQ_07220, partial [Eubacterium sp.]
MDNLQGACLISLNRWVDSIPDDIEDYPFSERHQKEMKRLFSKMRNDKYHRLTKRSARIILIAAILLSLVIATTVNATIGSRKPYVQIYTDHYTYKVEGGYTGDLKEDLTVGYIPDGFIKNNEFISTGFQEFTYNNSEGKTIYVSKYPSGVPADIDSDTHTKESIIYKGIEYTV